MFKIILFLLFFYTITWAFNLTIVHTNDIKARFEPFTSSGSACKENKVCYGGVVRRGSYVKQVRARESNVLLLDAGDQLQGTPWFFTYKGAATSFFLNELNYTAMALGDQEFSLGAEGLEIFLNNLTVPILCANLVMDTKVPNFMKNNMKDHIVVDFGEKKVGIIGYITSEATARTKTGSLTFEEEEKKIRKVAQNLTSKGINIIIAVGHSGFEKDKKMAAKIPEIDVFVGGRGHSFLYNGEPPTKEVVLGSYPVVVERKESNALVVQAGAYGKYVGTLKVTFDENGTVSKWSGNPVLMSDSIPGDDDLQEKVDLFTVKIKDVYEKVVGSTAMDFDTLNSICRVKECEMGNMYTDAMMEYNEKADLAIVNGGSFKGSFAKGVIKYGDAITVFPHNSEIKLVKLLGSYLRLVFEHSVEDFSLDSKQGKFLQVSKVFVKYDLTRPNGERVVDLQVYNKASEQYEEVLDDNWYNILATSYLVGGGDGYKVLELYHEDLGSSDALDLDIFFAYLKKNSPIKAELEGRINGMTTFPGWSNTYKEVPWDPTKNLEKNSSYGYRATLLTFIASFIATLVT